MCAMRYISDLDTPRSQSQAPTTPTQTLAEATNGTRAPRVAPMSPSPVGDPVTSQSSHEKALLGISGGWGEDEPNASVKISSVCRRLGLSSPFIDVTPVCFPPLLLPPFPFHPSSDPHHQYIPTTNHD